MGSMLFSRVRVTILNPDGSRAGLPVLGNVGTTTHEPRGSVPLTIAFRMEAAFDDVSRVHELAVADVLAVETWSPLGAGLSGMWFYSLFPMVRRLDSGVLVESGGVVLSVDGTIHPNGAWGMVDVPGPDGSVPSAGVGGETFVHGHVTSCCP